MKFLKTLTFCCFLALSCQSLLADSESQDSINQDITAFKKIFHEPFKTYCSASAECPYATNSHFGTAGFSVTDPTLWYTINTNSFPETVPLSLERNKGFAGDGVFPSPTGFTIGEAGNYWVSITAVLQNPSGDTPILIPVFLVSDETFDPTDPSPIGGIVSLPINAIGTVQTSGVLQNVTSGTRLSLVAANAGAALPQPVTVVAWGISLFKIQ